MKQGLLVHGSNHFIVNGPRPSIEEARKLSNQWEFPHPLRAPEPALRRWSICTKAFRENLSWAVVLHSEEAHTEAVDQLLRELEFRAIEIKR